MRNAAAISARARCGSSSPASGRTTASSGRGSAVQVARVGGAQRVEVARGKRERAARQALRGVQGQDLGSGVHGSSSLAAATTRDALTRVMQR